MDKQLTFFDRELAEDLAAKRGAEPCDPHVHPADVQRLTGQNAAIYERLQHGPASSAELAAISLKYTSRLSDLRAAGYVIECERTEQHLYIYRLKT